MDVDFETLDFEKILSDLANSKEDWTSSSSSGESDGGSICDSFSSDSGDSLIIYDEDDDSFARRKRKYRPRALLHDIRRSYAEMFTNVVNTVDFRMLYGFIDTFFSRNIVQIVSRYSMTTKENETLALGGVLSVAKYWYVATCPDATTTFFDTKICNSSDSRNNQIVSMYACSGIKLYDTSNPPQIPSVIYGCGLDEQIVQHSIKYVDDESDVTSDEDSQSSERVGGKRKRAAQSSPVVALEHIMQTLEDATDYLPLLEEPMYVKSLGRMIMHTDENNFITKLVIEMTYTEQRVSYAALNRVRSTVRTH
jgi:hypothetical protein